MQTNLMFVRRKAYEKNHFIPYFITLLVMVAITGVVCSWSGVGRQYCTLVQAAQTTGQTTEYQYVLKNGEITIKRYIGSKKNVKVPTKIKEKKVTAIGQLGEYDMPNPKIGVNMDSPYITSIQCNFNMSAYAGCSGITKVVVNSTNSQLIEENGIIYNKKKDGVLYVVPNYSGNLDFLKQVKFISYYAFTGFLQEKISVPDNIEAIYDGAFFGAKSTTIEWGKNVTYIPYHALAYAHKYCKAQQKYLANEWAYKVIQ